MSVVVLFRIGNRRAGVEGERRLGCCCGTPGGGLCVCQGECGSECGENGEMMFKSKAIRIF